MNLKRRLRSHAELHTGALNDILVIAVGIALYTLILFWGHAKLTGVALLP